MIVSASQLVSARGANTAKFAVSPPSSSVRSANRDSVPEARLRCPAQRPDARANPPAHLSRFLRPGDIEAFDARLRCPASNVAKAPTNTGSSVGGAPGTIFAKNLHLPAWQSAQEVV